MSSPTSSIEAAIARHDKEIGTMRADMHAIRGDMGATKSAVDAMAVSVVEIRSFISQVQANKPMAPIEAMQRWLSMAMNVGVLVGMFVAGIVYVSSNANNGEHHLMKYRTERIERLLDKHLTQPQEQPSGRLSLH